MGAISEAPVASFSLPSRLIRQEEIPPALLALLVLRVKDSRILAQANGGDDWVLPDEARWSVISGSKTPDILLRALRAVHRANAEHWVSSALASSGLERVARDEFLLASLIDAVGRMPVEANNARKLGATVDALLNEASRLVRFAAGPESSTPPTISSLLVGLAAPQPGETVYDPACGYGGTLLTAFRATTDRGDGPPITAYGQDINTQSASIAWMRFWLENVPLSLAIGDTLSAPQFRLDARLQTFDVIASHIPFSLLPPAHLTKVLEHDPDHRFPFGVSRRSADWLFAQHVVASLNASGRAALLMSPSALFARGRDEAIREALIKEDLIQAVISVPANLLNQSMTASVVVFNKAKPAHLRGKVVMIHATESYESQNGFAQLSKEQIQRLVDAVHLGNAEARLSRIVNSEEIAEQSHTLVPARFVDLVDRKSFLGGTVEWVPITKLAEVIAGTRYITERRDGGGHPMIRGRDLSSPRITMDDLERADLRSPSSKNVFTQTGDILIQRIGARPRAYAVDENIAGALVADTVQIIRPFPNYAHLASYVLEFLNSERGQAIVAAESAGSGAPTLALSTLRGLSIPVPEMAVIEILTNLRAFETRVLERVERARDIRKQLFSLNTKEEVDERLRSLSIEAQTLSGSLAQIDDLGFMIRNFFPFPLAYSYRAVEGQSEPRARYNAQLGVAENVAAFLAAVGLSLIVHHGGTADSDEASLLRHDLLTGWQKGMAMGAWVNIARRSARILHGLGSEAFALDFVQLWFKGKGRKESDVAQSLGGLVKPRNDEHHGRGLTTAAEFERGSVIVQQKLDAIFEALSVFVPHPLRLLYDLDKDWMTDQIQARTIQYVGDHPGMRHEQLTLLEPKPKDHLYFELGEGNWVSLFPMLSVHVCPKCGSRETYMVDGWRGPDGRARLKSFERGHQIDGDDAGEISDALTSWLNRVFP